jgi:riboflavin kinase/FMN adenylyltransferase
MLPEEKCAALHDFGIAQIDLLDFNAVREQSPEQFLDALCEKYRPVRLCCGYDYRFGKNAAGDPEGLAAYCNRHGIELYCAPCVCEDGQPISSTVLRKWLAQGELERANRYLYGGFGFTAEVLHGDARGRTIGFPTINQRYPQQLAPLRAGVYTARVLIDGAAYRGIANIGLRPTFRTSEVFSETYICDFSGELYGKTVTVKPLRFLRGEEKFDSLEALSAAIRRDLSALEE